MPTDATDEQFHFKLEGGMIEEREGEREKQKQRERKVETRADVCICHNFMALCPRGKI